MAVQHKYIVDIQWAVILTDMGIEPQDVIRVAGLPNDMFQRKFFSLTSADYFRFWTAIEEVSGDPLFPLALMKKMTPEAFSPPIFAALCSENLGAAIERISQFKPLIGPMRHIIRHDEFGGEAEIAGIPGDLDPPSSLILADLVFFKHLAQLGTRQDVVPLLVESPVDIVEADVYADYFGCPIRRGKIARIKFAREDLERPFLTASASMWAMFEPSLRLRLCELTARDPIKQRVRAWLNENIASGRNTIYEAATDLGISSRTLQRRLAEEGSSFKKELNEVRKGLAQHYLTQTLLSNAEIAFLLGYTEQNSFYRAFSNWTGGSPESVRNAHRHMNT